MINTSFEEECLEEFRLFARKERQVIRHDHAVTAVRQIVDTMNEDQKNVMYYIVGKALEKAQENIANLIYKQELAVKNERIGKEDYYENYI